MSARNLSCPNPERLSRVLTEGADEALHQHLAGCARCRAEWDAEAGLRGLIKEIRVPGLERDRLEAARSALLARAPRQPVRRRAPAPVMWAAALAAGVVLAVFARGWLEPGGLRGERRGTVVAHGSARFLHEDARRDEVVRLSDGEIHVEVARLHKGERFRVVVGGDEVEVRGTAFEVSARGDRLQGVRVTHGLVEVRPAGGSAVLLSAGQRWTRGEIPAEQPAAVPGAISASSPTGAAGQPAPQGALAGGASPVAGPPAQGPEAAPLTKPAAPAASGPTTKVARPVAHRPAKVARRAPQNDDSAGEADGAQGHGSEAASGPATIAAAPRAAAATTPRVAEAAPARPAAPAPSTAGVPAGTAEDRSFAAGWQALRARDYRGAAVAFGQTVKLAGDQPLAEDARYWLAVSQARAGQRDAAIGSLRSFLSRHPQSPRAPEASSILGWQLLRGGSADLDEADRLFRAAALAPLRQVRDSAQAGINAVTARRAADRAR